MIQIAKTDWRIIRTRAAMIMVCKAKQYMYVSGTDKGRKGVN